MLANPHLTARNYFVELPHPEVGKRRHLGVPWKMSRTPSEVQRPAPCLGQDNDYVLKDVLRLSDEEITALQAKNVFA
jgi:crotonobetainyl-CoA:carnitine CoA-transferase CaiB-like acyl-CoA transferase